MYFTWQKSIQPWFVVLTKLILMLFLFILLCNMR
jgi:hypothetical protein